MKRLYVYLFVALMLAAIMAVPAFAQEGDPPEPNKIIEFVKLLGQVAALVTVVAVVGERSTEVVKELLRKIGAFTGIKFMAVSGWGSALLALIVSAVAIYYPELDMAFFAQFELFKSVDPELV